MATSALTPDFVPVDLSFELQSLKDTRPALYDLVVRTFNGNPKHFRTLAEYLSNDQDQDLKFSERSVAYPYRFLAECCMLNLSLAHLLQLLLRSSVPEHSSLISVLLAICHVYQPLSIKEERLVINEVHNKLDDKTVGKAPIKVAYGSEVVMSVSVTGNPRPLLQWLKRDHGDNESRWRMIEGVQGSELRLEGFDRSDEGQYMCRLTHSITVMEGEEEQAQVIEGLDSTLMDLKLEAGSILVTKLPPSLLVVDEDSSVTLEVDARSELRLSFDWTLNNEKIDQILDEQEFCINDNGRELKLLNVNDLHVGYYNCRIHNDISSVNIDHLELSLRGEETVSHDDYDDYDDDNHQTVIDEEEDNKDDCSGIVIIRQPRYRTQRLSSGDSIRLRCTARSMSRNLKYEWVKQAFSVDVVHSPSSAIAVTPIIPLSRGSILEDEIQDKAEDKCVSFWLYTCLITCPISLQSKSSKSVKIQVGRHSRNRMAKPVSKFALIVCQETFESEAFHTLSAPRIDGSALVSTLIDLDFQVLALSNLSAQEMREAINLFCSFLESGCYALFYFNGHAISTEESLLLVMTDSVLWEPNTFVKQNEIESSIDSCNPMLAVVIYDSCRGEAPQVLKDALSKMRTATSIATTSSSLKSSFFIAYGTRPNMPSFEFTSKGLKEGLYMKHLLKHIRKDISVAGIFEQLTESFAQEEDHSLSLRMTPETKNCMKQIYHLTSPLRGARLSNNQKRFFNLTRYETLNVKSGQSANNSQLRNNLSFNVGLVESQEKNCSKLSLLHHSSDCDPSTLLGHQCQLIGVLKIRLEPCTFNNEAQLRLSLDAKDYSKGFRVQVIGLNVRVETREDKYKLEELYVTYVPDGADKSLEVFENDALCNLCPQMGPIFKLPSEEDRCCRLIGLQKLKEKIVLRINVIEMKVETDTSYLNEKRLVETDICCTGLVYFRPPIVANFAHLKPLESLKEKASVISS